MRWSRQGGYGWSALRALSYVIALQLNWGVRPHHTSSPMRVTYRHAVTCTTLGAALFAVACRSSGTLRTGPLPSAHSCYRMTGPLLQTDGESASIAVWLLLSDESSKRFGAHAYDAVIITNGVSANATWHRTGSDSLLVAWATPSGPHMVTFHSAPERITGLTAVEPSARTTPHSVSGTRAECATIATRTPDSVSHVP